MKKHKYKLVKRLFSLTEKQDRKVSKKGKKIGSKSQYVRNLIDADATK